MTRTDRLLLICVVAAGAGGLAISAYLTAAHHSRALLACQAGGAVDCARVVGSGYGVILGSGVPTSAAGILWFAVSIALAAVRLRLVATAPAWRLQLAWGIGGLAVVVSLVYLEVVRLNAICLWCTGAHALVLLSFALSALVPAQPGQTGAPRPSRVRHQQTR
jgi:uncharacterized membrane protein